MAVAKLAMAASEISQPRLQRLNQRDRRKGNYVLYWMQQAQRADYNDALEYAIQSANSLNQPLLAVFGSCMITRKRTSGIMRSCSKACAKRSPCCANAASS